MSVNPNQDYNLPSIFLKQVTPSSQPTSDICSLLAPFLNAKIIKERQYFLHQDINLDGQKFIECRFDGCTLYTETGDIYLQDCVFGDGNKVVFGEKIKKIVQLASMLDPQNVDPRLLANIKRDGTIQKVSII